MVASWKVSVPCGVLAGIDATSLFLLEFTALAQPTCRVTELVAAQ